MGTADIDFLIRSGIAAKGDQVFALLPALLTLPDHFGSQGRDRRLGQLFEVPLEDRDFAVREVFLFSGLRTGRTQVSLLRCQDLFWALSAHLVDPFLQTVYTSHTAALIRVFLRVDPEKQFGTRNAFQYFTACA